jgi:putative acetyltransferase
MDLSFRPEDLRDIDEIYELNKEVFGQDNEARLVDVIRQGPNFIPELSLVAVSEDKLIGYVLFSKLLVTNGGSAYEGLGLAPMMVHPDYQRKGVGAKLLTHGLQKAANMGFTSVLVLGHEHFYRKFGFLPASRWRIRPPFDVPADVFMALELQPRALANVSGVVEFPLEFSVM